MTEWLLAALVARVLLVVYLLSSTPSAELTKKSFDRIKAGMQLQKVKAILGAPPGDYRTGPTISCLRGFASFAVEDNTLSNLTWQGDRANIEVWIDPKRVVKYSSYECRSPMSVGVFRKLLWRIDRSRKSFLSKNRYYESGKGKKRAKKIGQGPVKMGLEKGLARISPVGTVHEITTESGHRLCRAVGESGVRDLFLQILPLNDSHTLPQQSPNVISPGPAVARRHIPGPES